MDRANAIIVYISLVPGSENMKGTIRLKIGHCEFFCCINSCSIRESCRKTTFLSFIVLPARNSFALCTKAFRDSCNRHLLLYSVEPNPSTPCKRRRSVDSSTSDFASPSPEPEDMEVEFPASPRGIPSRGRSGSFPANPHRLAFRAPNFIFSKANFSNSRWSQSRRPIEI